jgi:DNA-binding IclR family transcriptional regulator
MSQSVERAMTILKACARGPARLSDLGTELCVHKSTALRLLQTLEEGNFVRHLDDGTWTIGFGLTDIALDALDAIEIRAVARPWLVRLARELGHTLHLAELTGAEVIYVDKVEGHGAVRMKSRIGAPVVLHTAAVAKAILAFAPTDVLALATRDLTYQRFTASTLTSPGALAQELQEVRRRGWSVDDCEFEDYINCVAVPIRDHNGAVRFGMSLTALRAIEPLDRLKLQVPKLQAAADEISRALGWDGQKGREALSQEQERQRVG